MLGALDARLREIDRDFRRIEGRIATLEESYRADGGSAALERLERERDLLRRKVDRLARVDDDSWRLLTGEVSEALTSLAVTMVEAKERLEAASEDRATIS
jgi:hypothetical protein